MRRFPEMKYPPSDGGPDYRNAGKTVLGLDLSRRGDTALAGLGWALLRPAPGSSGEIETTDPVADTVAKWLSLPEPRPKVDLFRFETAEDFEHSRAAAEGCSHAEHLALIARTEALLVKAGARVRVVEGKA